MINVEGTNIRKPAHVPIILLSHSQPLARVMVGRPQDVKIWGWQGFGVIPPVSLPPPPPGLSHTEDDLYGFMSSGLGAVRLKARAAPRLGRRRAFPRIGLPCYTPDYEDPYYYTNLRKGTAQYPATCTCPCYTITWFLTFMRFLFPVIATCFFARVFTMIDNNDDCEYYAFDDQYEHYG